MKWLGPKILGWRGLWERKIPGWGGGIFPDRIRLGILKGSQTILTWNIFGPYPGDFRSHSPRQARILGPSHFTEPYRIFFWFLLYVGFSSFLNMMHQRWWWKWWWWWWWWRWIFVFARRFSGDLYVCTACLTTNQTQARWCNCAATQLDIQCWDSVFTSGA